MIILNIPLFKGLTLEQIEDMKNKHCMTEKKYKKNSFIFRAGDIVHEIGIVLEGRKLPTIRQTINQTKKLMKKKLKKSLKMKILSTKRQN